MEKMQIDANLHQNLECDIVCPQHSPFAQPCVTCKIFLQGQNFFNLPQLVVKTTICNVGVTLFSSFSWWKQTTICSFLIFPLTLFIITSCKRNIAISLLITVWYFLVLFPVLRFVVYLPVFLYFVTVLSFQFICRFILTDFNSFNSLTLNFVSVLFYPSPLCSPSIVIVCPTWITFTCFLVNLTCVLKPHMFPSFFATLLVCLGFGGFLPKPLLDLFG